MLAFWAWTQKYELAENRIIASFKEAGFETELDIVSVTSTQAKIKDIRLARDGEEILRIDSAVAAYVWPDVRDKKIKQIDLSGATAWVSLGEDWQPTQAWMKALLAQSSESGSGDSFPFPENGIILTDATFNLTAPIGTAEFFIDAQAKSPETFTADITLASSDLSYGGYSARGAGVVTLDKTEHALRITGQAQTETLSNEIVDIAEADLEIDGLLNLDTREFIGSTSLESESISSDLFASGPTRLGWDGSIAPQDGLRASGTWLISAENARSPRTERAYEVAETLSLYPALSVVPVTEHYAPQMRKLVFDFIKGADVAGQGRLDYGPDGFTINPIGTLDVATPRNQLRLRPRANQNFYRFEKPSSAIMAQMDASFDRPVGLTLEDIQLEATSNNGLRLEGISRFSTRLVTKDTWTTTDSGNRPARLGPLSANLRYAANRAPRRLSVTTALTYDGALPGSYVNRLNLDGRLDVRLFEGRQILDFTPRKDSVVTMGALETPTNWRGEDITFLLPPTKNLFERTAQKSSFAAILETADFTLTQPAIEDGPPQRLDLSAQAMNVSGTLHPDAMQDWTMAFTQAEYRSETLPGSGTTASAETANMTAQLMPGQAPQITFDSPAIFVETPQLSASDIQVAMQGTPDRYTVDHSGGMIFIRGSEIAERAKEAGLGSIPATGRVEFANGAFTGKASLNVEKANDAGVEVDYTYVEGVGTAHITVPSILFEPNGLQPQSLIPAFKGKIARVDGEARANLYIAFADGVLTESSGTVDLIDMAVGTAPGPITGLNTTLRFTSLLPLETDGPQTLTMKNFNPGFPLDNGKMTFSFVPDGVKIDAANWPIGNGWFSLDPFTWIYTAEENRVTMRLNNIELNDFLNHFQNTKIQATGTVVGELPIVIRGIDVLIEKGHISVPKGGVIKYDPGPGVQAYNQEEAIAVLREKRVNEYAALAQDALREFGYRELRASLDGPINGDVEIGLIFDGSNKKVLNRQPFRFDVTVKGELFNIARSFDSNAKVKSEIFKRNKRLPEGAIVGE